MSLSDSKQRAETTACRLTAAGRSAVAVIGIAGPAAADAIAACFSPATVRPMIAGDVRYGRWHGGSQESNGGGPDRSSAITPESVVVTPRSPSEFEIHCHGGPAAVARILDDLRRVGVRIVDPSAWRDQDSDQRQLITEAEQVLAHCRTPRTAAVAADQVRGAMLHWAQAEIVRLDTPSDGTVMKDQAAAERARLQAFRRRCETLLQDAEFGVHLTEPFHVVLAGRPNVGKSSLINALVGYERSITYDQPGTTRDLLHAETVIDGIPIRLTDTAGLRDSREPIESQGVSRARGLLADADLLVWVQDVKLDDEGTRLPDDRTFPVEWSASDRQLWVLNKCDRLPPGGGGAPKSAEASCTFDRQLAVSATTGVGIQTMQQAIVALLVPRFPPPRSAVPITERQRRCLLHASAAGSVAEAIDWLKRLKGDAYSPDQSSARS